MFIERKLSKILPAFAGERNLSMAHYSSPEHALRWSSSRRINAPVYKHSSPPEPACLIAAFGTPASDAMPQTLVPTYF